MGFKWFAKLITGRHVFYRLIGKRSRNPQHFTPPSLEEILRQIQRMKETIFSISIFILLNSCFLISEAKYENEILIYNTLLDSLYNVMYCHNGMYFPRFRFYNKDTTTKEYKEYVFQYEKWKSDRESWIKEFKQELDTLELITFVKDSFTTLDLDKGKEFLLKEMNQKDSLFVMLLKNKKLFLESKPLIIDSLKQGKIKFLSEQLPFFKNTDFFQYGKVDRNFYIGQIELSRIYIDEKKEIGIFHFDYIGGGKCGYGRYVFIIKINDKWVIYKMIGDWIS